MSVSTESGDLETKLRYRLAATTLMLNTENILGYSGHVSVLLPGGGALLIQPIDESRATLRPEQLLVCNLDGKVCSGAAGEPPAEIFIHTEIYRARPDVAAIAHFHHELSTVFSLVEDVPLVPVKNHAVRWETGIPTHPDPGHVSSPALGRALAATLGHHNAAVIRAHGQVVVSEDLCALFADCIHFVENAEALYRAATIGKVKPLTEDDFAGFRRSVRRPQHAAKLWNYYLSRAEASIPKAWFPFLV